jgi:glutamine synthetase
MAQVESKNRATSDPGARKDVLKEIKERGIEDVLLWFTDLEGHLKSFSITVSEVEGALDDGMGFDGSSITGLTRSRNPTWSRSPIPRPSE